MTTEAAGGGLVGPVGRPIHAASGASAPDDTWCFAWFAGAVPGAGVTRAALRKTAMWQSGDRITVSFLSGDDVLKQRVRDMAGRWIAPGMANLDFAFRDDPDTDIRISFQPGRGSWSTVGTTCRQVPAGMATMNFGTLRADTPEADLRRVVLHEFGHAIGLIHEHQSPMGGIRWNRQAVIADLSGPPNNWSEEQIALNVLDAPTAEELAATTLDPDSIMMYTIPAHWTEDGFSTARKSDFSALDRTFIRQQYT
jgi:serralysin